MAAYSYKALAPDGTVSKGVVEGESERQVRNLLRAKQLDPLEVAPSRLPGNTRDRSRATLTTPALVLLTRQLATLVKAGVPLDEALSACARQNPDPGAKALVLQLRSKLVAGQSLAASLAGFEQLFSPMYRAMIRAGEQAGMLGEVMEKLAGYLENRYLLQHRLQLALIYPLVLFGVALSVVALLMTLVLPELADLFERTDTSLPLLTRILMGLSQGLAQWWPVLLTLILVVITGSLALLKQARWRQRFDALVLRLPLIGRVQSSADTARFASTLSMLVHSSVALVDAIGIAAQVMSNTVLRSRAAHIATDVGEGGTLARALETATCFSPMMVQLVASGEGSGNLETMLAKAAQSQEQELELTLNSLLKLVEPLIIVVMAVLIGAIVLAVLLPIMQMNTLVG